jgi:polyphosphate:AMP phosphotransferase
LDVVSDTAAPWYRAGMFDSADLEHKIDKLTYRHEVPHLRESLLNAQVDLNHDGRFPVIIVIAGVEGAGKSEVVNILSEWMDPRFLVTTAFDDATDEERERPRMWRYWRALPPKGRVGILFGAWHTEPVVDRVFRRISSSEFDKRIAEIMRFEQMLADEGALILKFWFHLTKKQQKKRLSALEKDPKTRWRVTSRDWKYFKRFDAFEETAVKLTRQTSTGEAPWIVVAGADSAYRNLTVGRTILAAMRERLGEKPAGKLPDKNPLLPPVDHLTVLRALDLDQPLTEEQYGEAREKWQGRLATLTRDTKFKRTGVVAVFEGNDAAGKGGAIRRVTQALDARLYQGISIAAPTEEERAKPYLWRFWRHIPRLGRVALFDRSWYGRVLVERVEGFCAEADWMRAYGEINDFERDLVEHDLVVVKFWLAIDKEVQLKRFREREKTSFKRFKITAEDWRNRKKWDAYEAAVCDMVDRTSTEFAPWTLVEANNKYFTRIKVLRTMCKAIEERFDAL